MLESEDALLSELSDDALLVLLLLLDALLPLEAELKLESELKDREKLELLVSSTPPV